MRGAATVAAVAMLVFGGLGLGGAAPERAGEDWRGKADRFLLGAYDQGQPWLTVQLRGDPLPAPAVPPADRAAWRAHWDAASASFVDPLRLAVARAGGEVTSVIEPVNALSARVPHGAVPGLLARADVRSGALDWVGAMGLLDGAPGEPGVQVTLGTAGTMIQVPELWALGYRGEGVKVAVLDTGVRSSHEMMKRADGTTRVAGWADFTNHNCASPCDGNGHGTHTTTTAVGSNLFNPNSPQGMAPRATVLHGKVLDNGGSGAWSWGQEGLEWAFDQGADLTSNSWGGTCGGAATTTGELAEELADAGMLSVFAGGNAGPGPGSVHCPGAADRVLTVGAVNSGEVVAGFSGRGPCTWAGARRICPDVMAMGVSLEAGWYNSDTAYASISGTSMSTPGVAGLAALLQQASRDLRGRGLDATRQEPEVLLRATAKDLGTTGPDHDYGWGLAKGKVARDVLASTAALDLRATAGFPAAVLHGGQTADVLFQVAQLGTAAATGRFRLEFRQLDFGACPPACEVVVLADRTVTLAQAQAARVEAGFAASDHAPGNWLATGTFEYTYTDPADGQVKSGVVTRSAAFQVKRVVWQAAHQLPAAARTGDVLHAGLALVNVGNADAISAEVWSDWRAGAFAPVPLVPPGDGPLGALTDPGVNAVSSPAPTQGTVRYAWAAGTLGPGAAWDARYDFAAAQPGTWRFTGRVTWQGEAGGSFALSFPQDVAVALP